ncbi:MAG TPA: hypothetical protein DCM27_02960 [Rhodospirillaceae bacterium]|nr:hypothetical protein [Rhodospirillaceae bacterium]
MKTKYIVMILAASVLLNAFCVGMITSCKWDMRNLPFPHKAGGPPPMEDMVLRKVEDQKHQLSAAGQKQLDHILAQYRPLLTGQQRDDMPQLFAQIHQVVTAETFDKAKLVSLHHQINNTEMKGRETVGNMMTEIAASLSDADRLTFFKEFIPEPPHKR